MYRQLISPLPDYNQNHYYADQRVLIIDLDDLFEPDEPLDEHFVGSDTKNDGGSKAVDSVKVHALEKIEALQAAVPTVTSIVAVSNWKPGEVNLPFPPACVEYLQGRGINLSAVVLPGSYDFAEYSRVNNVDALKLLKDHGFEDINLVQVQALPIDSVGVRINGLYNLYCALGAEKSNASATACQGLIQAVSEAPAVIKAKKTWFASLKREELDLNPVMDVVRALGEQHYTVFVPAEADGSMGIEDHASKMTLFTVHVLTENDYHIKCGVTGEPAAKSGVGAAGEAAGTAAGKAGAVNAPADLQQTITREKLLPFLVKEHKRLTTGWLATVFTGGVALTNGAERKAQCVHALMGIVSKMKNGDEIDIRTKFKFQRNGSVFGAWHKHDEELSLFDIMNMQERLISTGIRGTIKRYKKMCANQEYDYPTDDERLDTPADNGAGAGDGARRGGPRPRSSSSSSE